jgi:hypothetical protein
MADKEAVVNPSDLLKYLPSFQDTAKSETGSGGSSSKKSGRSSHSGLSDWELMPKVPGKKNIHSSFEKWVDLLMTEAETRSQKIESTTTLTLAAMMIIGKQMDRPDLSDEFRSKCLEALMELHERGTRTVNLLPEAVSVRGSSTLPRLALVAAAIAFACLTGGLGAPAIPLAAAI